MKLISRLLPALPLIFLISCGNDEIQKNHSLLTPVNFSNIKITDSFWAPRLQKHATVTLDACIDQIQNQTARISNFEKAAGLKEGSHIGIYFDDSDVYKAMEGMAYSLVNNPNPKIEKILDSWIDLIAGAQEPDGYVNTYYSLTGLENRWTDMTKHEMYCGGHMIEAAIAYFNATGKRKFLDVVIRFADHLDSTFGPGKRHWVPGHQEIELALVKLYHVTNNTKYLNLAQWLLEERGHNNGVGWIWEKPEWGPRYCQDDVPVSQISSISGHAVRAMYMFTGMADVASETGDTSYISALNRVWEDVVFRNMYITGGIGSSGSNEGFTEDYDLPNLTAYCETCASVGMVLWNQRMNNLTGDSKYTDILERCLYNGALAGISLSGDRFFYDNPLESLGGYHRSAWFGCACCPSQISRFLPSVGNYIYSLSEKDVWVNLYIGSNAKINYPDDNLEIIQSTNYPWDGNVVITVNPAKPVKFGMRLRIPGWCKEYSIKVNSETVETPEAENGYVIVKNKWKQGDQIELNLSMPVKLEEADPKVKADIGKRTIQRGPLVYCMEQTDNRSISFDSVQISGNTQFEILEGDSIQADLKLIKAREDSREYLFLPYYAWDNREAGRMVVWVKFGKKDKNVR
jgi:DUF1680 family protein